MGDYRGHDNRVYFASDRLKWTAIVSHAARLWRSASFTSAEGGRAVSSATVDSLGLNDLDPRYRVRLVLRGRAVLLLQQSWSLEDLYVSTKAWRMWTPFHISTSRGGMP